MSRKHKLARGKEPQGREETAASYYQLKTRAVDDLVTANEENSPKVSPEEIRKYTSRRLKVADWVKLVLIRWWFAAAVCFFFLWGLGTYVPHLLDLLVITGIASGFVTDLLTNNVLRFVSPAPGANDRWMMYPRKGFVSLPLNLLHAGVVLFLVYTAYNALNALLILVFGMEANSVPLGVEPILFGTFTMAWDMLFLGFKRLGGRMVNDAKTAAKKH